MVGGPQCPHRLSLCTRWRSRPGVGEGTSRAATRCDRQPHIAPTGALQRETRTIPIVFTAVADPIGSGFVASLAQPGANITGFLLFEASITGKWLAMLRDMVPALARATLVINPKTAAYYEFYLRAAQAARSSLGIELALGPIGNEPAEIKRVFEAFARTSNGGLLLPPDINTSPRPAHRACGPAPLARGLLGPSLRRGRWADVLHHRPSRYVPGGGHVCRSYPARRQACRSSGAGANQVRNCHQSQDGESTWPYSTAGPARRRRRSDRMRQAMSAFGPKRTFHFASHMSAFGGKADKFKRCGISPAIRRHYHPIRPRHCGETCRRKRPSFYPLGPSRIEFKAVLKGASGK
jgi:hypothetical protein